MDAAGVPRLVGQAHFTRERGRLSTTFLQFGWSASEGVGAARRRQPRDREVPACQ